MKDCPTPKGNEVHYSQTPARRPTYRQNSRIARIESGYFSSLSPAYIYIGFIRLVYLFYSSTLMNAKTFQRDIHPATMAYTFWHACLSTQHRAFGPGRRQLALTAQFIFSTALLSCALQTIVHKLSAWTAFAETVTTIFLLTGPRFHRLARQSQAAYSSGFYRHHLRGGPNCLLSVSIL